MQQPEDRRIVVVEAKRALPALLIAPADNEILRQQHPVRKYAVDILRHPRARQRMQGDAARDAHLDRLRQPIRQRVRDNREQPQHRCHERRVAGERRLLLGAVVFSGHGHLGGTESTDRTPPPVAAAPGVRPAIETWSLPRTWCKSHGVAMASAGARNRLGPAAAKGYRRCQAPSEATAARPRLDPRGSLRDSARACRRRRASPTPNAARPTPELTDWLYDQCTIESDRPAMSGAPWIGRD
jgi:hypothetical protein